MRITNLVGLGLALTVGTSCMPAVAAGSGHGYGYGSSYRVAAVATPYADGLAAPAARRGAVAVQAVGVQVWLDGHRDLLHPNDRVRVRVRTDRDGYLAVFHIDTNGDLDILFPRSPSDDGWTERGRTLALGSLGGWNHLRVRGGAGVGYIFAVALDEPLEVWRMRDLYRPRSASWESGRTIWGDPFYAMDEVVRAIVPEGAYGYESVDYHTYYVGRRYTHPRYACYDGYGDWYYSRATYWSSCDRVRIILVHRPFYYDTWGWRGHRRPYYERYYATAVRTRAQRPLHGYKERTDSYAPPARTVERRPQPAAGTTAATGASTTRARPGAGSDGARPSGGAGAPSARDGEAGSPRVRPPAPGGVRGAPAGDAGAERPVRDEPRGRPDRIAPPADERPARETPVREQPVRRQPVREAPAREQPVREQPVREAPVREAPVRQQPAREAPPREQPVRQQPVRESPPPASSAPAPRQRESAPAPAPRSMPADGGSRSSPPARPRDGDESMKPIAKLELQQQQEDRPVDRTRERPTFQRRGTSDARAAQPRRDPAPAREARPQQDTGSSSRPSDSSPPASRPPEG